MILKDYMEACQVEKNSVLLQADPWSSGGFMCGNVSLEDGVAVKFSAADMGSFDLYYAQRIAVGSFGANFNISSNGFSAGLGADIFRLVGENENLKFAMGLNFSSAVQLQNDAMKVYVFGIGFEYDKYGLGFRTPVFEWKYRWWQNETIPGGGVFVDLLRALSEVPLPPRLSCSSVPPNSVPRTSPAIRSPTNPSSSLATSVPTNWNPTPVPDTFLLCKKVTSLLDKSTRVVFERFPDDKQNTEQDASDLKLLLSIASKHHLPIPSSVHRKDCNALYRPLMVQFKNSVDRDNFLAGFLRIQSKEQSIQEMTPKPRCRRDLTEEELKSLKSAREYIHKENLKAGKTVYILSDIVPKINRKPRPFRLPADSS